MKHCRQLKSLLGLNAQQAFLMADLFVIGQNRVWRANK
jgi:hypothetical protein